MKKNPKKHPPTRKSKGRAVNSFAEAAQVIKSASQLSDEEMFLLAYENAQLPSEKNKPASSPGAPSPFFQALKKQLRKRGLEGVIIDKTLDLHGYTTYEAGSKLDQFIQNSIGKNQLLHVITGIGNHSKDGPVLYSFVKRHLAEGYAKDKLVILDHHSHKSLKGSFLIYTRNYVK